MFDQLSALAFDLGGEVLLIGAQGVGGGDQGGALLAEAFLDGLDLLGDARTGVLKSDGLARQIVGSDPSGVLGFAGGGGEVGGPGGERRFGFTQLRLSQVRGVGDHARLPLDGVDDARRLRIQMDAQGLHLVALAAQVFGETTRGAAGVLGRLVQARCLLGQRLSQQGHVVAGAFRGQGGVIDVGTQRLKHLAGLLCGQGSRGDEGLGQLPGATRLCGQTRALSDGMGQHDGQARRGKGDQGVDGDSQRIQFGAARAELIGRP